MTSDTPMGEEMPKTNARKNIHRKKQAKMRMRNWALKETVQGPRKTPLKPK
jgi:hypothetical protein